MRHLNLLLMTAGLICCAASAAWSQTRAAFIYEHWHYEIQQNPQGFGDVVAQALDNPTVANSIKGIAAFWGIPPSLIDAGTIGAKAYKAQWKGQENYPQWTPPPGYLFCNARVTAQRNYIGRGSMSLTMNSNLLHSYVWLQQRRWGEGRSLFDIELDIVYVRADLHSKNLADRKCVPDNTRIINVQFWPGNKQRHDDPIRTAF